MDRDTRDESPSRARLTALERRMITVEELLRGKKAEIEAEIEAFQQRKWTELAAYETTLRGPRLLEEEVSDVLDAVLLAEEERRLRSLRVVPRIHEDDECNPTEKHFDIGRDSPQSLEHHPTSVTEQSLGSASPPIGTTMIESKCHGPYPPDTTGSLRSSIKNPRQPRSPKHVLFSLEESTALVSPSSSPVRRKPGMKGLPAPVFKKSKIEQQTGTVPEEKNASSFFMGWTKQLPVISAKPMHEIPARPVAPTSLSEGYEQIESADEDLFAFDEELSPPQMHQSYLPPPPDIPDEEEPEPPAIETTESPHAGSLPIEIKWPERRQMSVGVM